jgi:hypothetical protein
MLLLAPLQLGTDGIGLLHESGGRDLAAPFFVGSPGQSS